MDTALIEILRCPESGQPLVAAPLELVQRLERLRKEGILRDSNGGMVREAIQYGLVRQDGTRLYPVRDGIPVLLREESIEIPRSIGAGLQSTVRPTKTG
jgi:uncharacterized protein YbaR (Trm112 family)